jgi:6-phosphogluconolactonase
MPHKIFLMFLFIGLLSTSFGQNKTRTYLFIGTYTEGKSDQGIFVYGFNSQSGKCKRVGAVDSIINPSFLTLSPNGRFLYVCTDTKMPIPGSVTAFTIDSVHGHLALLNKQPCGGENPVYVAVHKDGRFVVCANYTGGSVTVFPIKEDGSLKPYTQLVPFTGSSVLPDRQDKPYIHSAVFSPQGDYLYLPDLGADQIRAFKIDATVSRPLISMEGKNVHCVPGSGPRHFTFHPTLPYAYCIEELSGMVSAYSYNHGKLDSIQRIFSYSKTQESYGGADIHISPDGLFLYASNRLHDENTIAIFSIDQQKGILKLIGHQKTGGDHPRNFTIDPTGKFLLVANLATNNIVIFKRDLKTGLLKKTKNEISVPRPSCLQMRSYRLME